MNPTRSDPNTLEIMHTLPIVLNIKCCLFHIPIDVYHAFANNGNTMTLSCPSTRTITVQSGYYGQYDVSCDQPGCPPNPTNCKESIENNTPSDWETLTESCNEKTTCDWDISSREVASCGGTSDYALVYYSCLPGYGFFLMGLHSNVTIFH